MQSVQQTNVQRSLEEQQAAAAQEVELQQLLAARAQAAALRAGGAGDVATAIGTGAGQAVSALAAEQQALELATAQTGTLSDEDLLKLLQEMQGSTGSTGSTTYDYSSNL